MTHTVTHTPRCPERDKERQTGSFAFLHWLSSPFYHNLQDSKATFYFLLSEKFFAIEKNTRQNFAPPQ